MRTALAVGTLVVLAVLCFVLAGHPRGPVAQFGSVSLSLDLATTTAEEELGLGDRASLPPDRAMLFVFGRSDYYGFWMKDMRFPIDIIWLDAQGQVITVAADVATSTYPHVFYPSAPAAYVLETAAGLSARTGLAPGSTVLLKNLPNNPE